MNETRRSGNKQEASTTPIGSYHADGFLKWEGWHEVLRLLENDGHGLCAGVGGSRGCGKTWILRYAVDRANGDRCTTTDRADEQAKVKRGIGVYFPAPSFYNSAVFVSSLCEKLADVTVAQLQGKLPWRVRFNEWLTTGRRLLWLIAVYVVIVLAFGLAIGYYVSGGRFDPIVAYLWLAWSPFLFLLLFRSSPQSRRSPDALLYSRAVALKSRIQFSSVSNSTSELSAAAGKGITFSGRMTEGLTLAERPVTELTLVNEFRSLAEDLAREGHQVVIAIDELDRISSVDQMRELLSSVKGVLDPAGVFLLVAVSDEATTHLGLAGLGARDEISSTFDTIVRLPPLTKEETRDLLSRPPGGVPSNGQALSSLAVGTIWTLTGGNPRESVRLLDDCVRECAGDLTPEALICTFVRQEHGSFVDSIVHDPALDETSRARAYEWLHERFTDEGLPRKGLTAPARIAHAAEAIYEGWNPATGDDGWPASLLEPWRRFLVRRALTMALWTVVLGADADGQGSVELEKLEKAISLSRFSARIAFLEGAEHVGELNRDRLFPDQRGAA